MHKSDTHPFPDLSGVMYIAHVELPLADGATLFGVGIDKNIVVARLKQSFQVGTGR